MYNFFKSHLWLFNALGISISQLFLFIIFEFNFFQVKLARAEPSPSPSPVPAVSPAPPPESPAHDAEVEEHTVKGRTRSISEQLAQVRMYWL